MSYGLNLWSRKKEYHKFVTEDLALLTMGLGVYNLSSAETFCQLGNARNNPELIEFFGQTFLNLKNLITGVGLENTMKINEFNLEEKIFEPATGLINIHKLSPQKYPPDKFNQFVAENTIEAFLKKWNDVQSGQSTDEKLNNTYKAIVDKINNSQEGCITFETTINALGVQRKAKIKLYLLYNQDSETSRVVTLNGAPMISAIPTTPYGPSYSGPATLGSSPGIYQDSTANNIGDRVAGQLRTTFDPSTGQFESGTQQIMARLLDDIDPADQPQLTTQELSSLSRDDVYNGPDGLGFMGNFSKGRAMPLSAERGNPHLFGPDFRGGCENPTTKAIITVINRLGQSYKAGDIVVCSRLIGEGGNWVIVSAGRPSDKTATKPINFGPFEFSRWLVSLSNFFSSNQGVKITPSDYLSKIRSHYYSNANLGDFKSILASVPNTLPADVTERDRLINLLLSAMPSEVSDPIAYLESALTDSDKILGAISAGADRFIDGVPINTYLTSQIEKTFDTFPQVLTTGSEPSFTGFLPKNATVNNVDKLLYYEEDANGDPVETPRTTDLPPRANEAPFWGILFPDGYTTNSIANLFSRNSSSHLYLKNNPLFKDDANKVELDGSAAVSFIDLKTGDPTDNFIFNQNQITRVVNLPPATEFGFGDFKKTGAILGGTGVFNVLNTWNPASVQYGVTGPTFTNALEPLNPAKIQFSSMSMDFLYSASNIAANAFFSTQFGSNQYLKSRFVRTLSFVNGVQASDITNLYDYYQRLWGISNGGQNHPDTYRKNTDGNPFTNTYNTPVLLWDNAFVYIDGINRTQLRHPSPLGAMYKAIPYGPKNALISEDVNIGYRYTPAVPILTCKSKVVTTASSLSFKVSQLLGMHPQLTVSPGNGPKIVALPFGGGLFWTDDPGVPSSQQRVPQWGDRSKTDNIDSLGTSALHVRAYEHWPENQTVFLAPIYTILHFNPVSTPYKYVIKDKKNSQNITTGNYVEIEIDSNGQQVPRRSSVDFKEPTLIGGAMPGVGVSVDKNNLAPFSEWKWNPKRRGALLSGGGFGYTKRVIGIIPSTIKLDINDNGFTLGGQGYNVGDTFVYGDGTTIEVTAVGTRNINGSNAENSIINFKVIKDGKNGITSVSNNKIQPSYVGQNGTGAKFDEVSFIIKEALGYDPAPKEVIPITRLTKPSNGGAKEAEGDSTTILTLSDTSKKQYDLYYFFHNDPTHYADNSAPFNAGWSQYAIVEVAGA